MLAASHICMHGKQKMGELVDFRVVVASMGKLFHLN